MTDPSSLFWYCVRTRGVATRSGWLTGVPFLNIPQHVDAKDNDIVEVNALQRSSSVSPDDYLVKFSNRQRGIVGVELQYEDTKVRFAPSYMITSNLGFDRALHKFLIKTGVSEKEFSKNGQVRVLKGRQFLLTADSKLKAELTRGSTCVPHRSIEETSRIEKLVFGIGHWLMLNLSDQGELPYKYWPSRGEWSSADNAIRRFLGSLSLARLAEYRNSADLKRAARDNLRYNLGRYFKMLADGRGAIVESTGAKLGGAAIAGLAILENHYSSEFNTELQMLAKGIEHLAEGKRGFRTFFFPKERDGQNWNFYSGEALLFWAEAIRRRVSVAPSLERYMSTFRLCREWHRRNRNPAFVPWHTQACAILNAITNDREFSNFAFEMNDWLLPMQQWDGIATDMRGRFYDPLHREWGPPHAASTGVYCEGLADALALANALGDSGRIEQYSTTLSRGMRSLRQLQFRNSTDAFYVSRKDRVMGALRTEVYDNSVRIDSAAHALLAGLKILNPFQTPQS